MATTEKNKNGLQDSPSSYREAADGKVFISWYGRQVMVLKGLKAKSFLRRLAGLDAAAQQLIMAKETGNFKRGNER